MLLKRSIICALLSINTILGTLILPVGGSEIAMNYPEDSKLMDFSEANQHIILKHRLGF